MKRVLAAASLLVLAACQQPGPPQPKTYATSEEGLTLVFMDPSLPKDQQDAQRLQVRVDKVVDRDDGAIVVFKSFTVGLHEPFQALFVEKDGGVGILSADGKVETPVLPVGFPDSTAVWSRGGVTYQILGRGSWVHGAHVLPSGRASEGVWVEARPARGAVTRSLYLPGLGEVETDERLPDGRWSTVNLLTQYGFTELPQAPVPETAPSKPAPKAKQPSKRVAKP